MVKDLTVGKPSAVLWRFSLPLFVSVIFQQLYNIADSVIAGKFAGEDALAAVGASYPITMIFMAIAVGSNIGCSVVISRLFGAKKYGEMKTAVSTTLLAGSCLAAVLTAGGVLGSAGMMRMIQTPDNVFGNAALYLQIYIGGFLFLFLYNICTGIFQALGDSKTPLYFLIGSSLGNVLLDWIFVAFFHWNVAGVAWATFLAQGIACLLAFITLLMRLKKIPSPENSPVFSFSMLGKVSKIAVPSILQQSFISLGNLFIQGLINSYGSSVIAGYSAAVKLNTFAVTSLTTLGNGVSSFTAQNTGAGRYGRVKEGFWTGVQMGLLVAGIFFLCFFLFSSTMIALFLDQADSSTTALQTGIQFLKVVVPFYFVVALKLIADGVLRGAEDMRAFLVSTFTDLILRVVLSYALAAVWDTTGIFLSWPIGWTVATLLSLWFYKRGNWQRSHVPFGEEETLIATELAEEL